VRTLRLVPTVAVAVGLLGLLIIPSSLAASSGQMTLAFGPTPMLNPCNNLEPVIVTGLVHTVWIMSDNRVETQTNWPDTSGIGASGTYYQANQTTHFAIVEVPKDSATIIFQESEELISQGPSPNFLVHFAFVIDFNTSEVKFRGDPTGVCSG
jgi:hypothetical protein